MLTLSILPGNLHYHGVTKAAVTNQAFWDAVASNLKTNQAKKKAIKTQNNDNKKE